MRSCLQQRRSERERCQHKGRYIMTGLSTNDVRGVIEELCIIIADIDPMGDRGGRGIPWGRRVIPRGGGSG